jgi:hypothetical protein
MKPGACGSVSPTRSAFYMRRQAAGPLGNIKAIRISVLKNVFLSYGREDREFVELLDRQLRNRGIACWWDKKLEPGVQWSKNIEAELNAAGSVIVVWSENACDSEMVRCEARIALNEGKLLQLRLDESPVPLGFGERQYVGPWSNPTDCFNSRDFARLIDTIKQRTPCHDSRTNALRLVLAQYFGVELKQYLGKGEISEIWLGKIGFRTVTVKVVRGYRIEDAVGANQIEQFKSVLRDQLNELRSFNRRHYLRIWDLKLVADLESLCAEAGQLKDDWIVISDYSPGISLSELVRERVESGKLLSSEQRISDQTISIARQLAAALWEGEYHNLQLMRFTPEEIYIEHNEQDGTPLVRFAPLSITGLVEYVARAVKWTDEAGPYTAPELWNEKLPVFTADGAKRGELSAKIDRANQFTFGMILWFMLRGDLDFKSYPDEASHATIVRFEQWVRGLSAAVTSCSARGLKRRALCRIVERLVRFNPNERWEREMSRALLNFAKRALP